MIINQIKNLLSSLEEESSPHQRIVKQLELAKLISTSIVPTKEDINKMNEEDILSDALYEAKETMITLTHFIDTNIGYLEEEYHGTDFETQLSQTSDDLKKSDERLIQLQEQLKQTQQLSEQLQKNQKTIESLQEQIAHYTEFNKRFEGIDEKTLQSELELLSKKHQEKYNQSIETTTILLTNLEDKIKTIKQEHQELEDQEKEFQELKKASKELQEAQKKHQTELQIYRTHLNENLKLNFKETKGLATKIKQDLELYDSKIKELMLTIESLQNEIREKQENRG
jgi:hypothetical protein